LKHKLTVGRVEKAVGLSTLEARDEGVGLDDNSDIPDWVPNT